MPAIVLQLRRARKPGLRRNAIDGSERGCVNAVSRYELPQNPFVDFAGRPLGQLVDDADAARVLVACHPLTAIGDQLLFGRRVPFARVTAAWTSSPSRPSARPITAASATAAHRRSCRRLARGENSAMVRRLNWSAGLVNDGPLVCRAGEAAPRRHRFRSTRSRSLCARCDTSASKAMASYSCGTPGCRCSSTGTPARLSVSA